MCLLPTLVHALAIACLPASAASDCSMVWQTGWRNETLGGSHINTIEDREVADDFDFSGNLGRIIVEGYGPSGVSVPIDGVWVRFYAWTAAGPGALQSQRFIAAGDPHLRVLAAPQTLDILLAQPFQGSGKHFLSVQVDFAPSGTWWPWIGSDPTPQLSHAWVRDNLAGGGWGAYVDILGQVVDADMSFELYSAPIAGACASWVEEPTPIPNPEYTILRDLSVIGADDVWSVGHYKSTPPGSSEQFTLAMHWDGALWSTVPTPSPAPAPGMSNDYLWAVDSIASDDVWAGGEQNMQVPGGWVGSQPFAIHWDGSSWTEVVTPIPPTSIGAGYTGSSVLEIEAISTNDVWFLGRWNGPYPGTSSTRPAMAMHWDGSSITQFSTPVLAGAQSIHAADSSGPNNVWAIGSMTSAQTQYPYVLRWDGSTWSQVLMPPAGVTQSVHDISVLAPNDVYVLAIRNVGTGTGNFLMHYNGSGWTQAAVPALGSLHVKAANDIWIAGAQIQHFDGSAWSVVDDFSCIAGPSFAALDGVGSSLWAVGRQLSAGLFPLTVHSTAQSCGAFTYCTSSTTSNGCTPSIGSNGTPSATAGAGFVVNGSNFLNNKSCLLFYGTSGQAAIAFQGKILCVKSPIKRTPGTNTLGNPPPNDCSGAPAIDMNLFALGGLGGTPLPALTVPGTVVDCQWWGRDPGFAPPNNTQLSDGLEYVVLP